MQQMTTEPVTEAAETTPKHQVGERAVVNTAVRAVGEVVGKLASLALFAEMGRSLGQAGLGVFTFGMAFVQITTIPVDFGMDRYLVRRVARDRGTMNSLFARVLSAKLILTGPVAAATVALVTVLGYGTRTRETVYVLTAGFVFDAMARAIFGLFMAVERSGMLAITVVIQRVLVAIAGILALHNGYGVVTVAICYTSGSLLSILIAAGLLAWRIGMPPLRLTAARMRELFSACLPFAAQDVFTVLLFKLDAVILSLMSTAQAVGRYGAAYRLLESTFFIDVSLAGAFAAMYTYLGPDTDPPISAVFQRSLGLAQALLMPIAVGFGLLAGPICRLIFGPQFLAAGAPLRLLAPVVVLLGLVMLCQSLIVSRSSGRAVVKVTAWMVLLNAVLNVALIPLLADRGSATAMLVTEAAFIAISLLWSVRLVGGVNWWAMSGAPLLAGLAMALAILPLRAHLLPGALVGAAVYVLALVALQLVIAPQDVNFALSLVRRRLALRRA